MLSSRRKKKIWIKAHGLKLTQNIYSLVVMKYLMKTFPLARKTPSTARNWKNWRKLGNTKFQECIPAAEEKHLN